MASVTSHGAPRQFASPTVTVRRVTFSSSYTTNGETVTAKDLGLNQVFAATCTIASASAGAVANCWYDIVNAKLKAFTTTAEVANAVNLSGVTVEIVAFGKN